MALERLVGSAEDLMSKMRQNGFSDSYMTEVMTEIRWLGRHGVGCDSLEEACLIRCGELGTPGTARKVRSIFGLLRHFDTHGDCPSPGEGHVLSERGARLGLTPCFREVVDAFSKAGLARGLRESTVNGCASSASTFFASLQELGRDSLADVTGMLIESIAWEADEIRIVQRKTGGPLVLPLVPIVGNSVLDYLERERPASGDSHLFLSCRPPHGPIGATCVSNAASRIYDAAGVRMERGDRRGTHLFRHHAASRMVDAGVPRAVVSATLGHSDQASLDRYLAADVEQLRTCSLSVERFPVREGVLGR